MVNYGIRGNLAIGGVLAIIKSILMPFVVFVVAAHVIGLPSVWVGVATLIAACPTGVFSFIMANQFGTGHAMSTNGIAITTAISVFTVSFWLWFIQVQGY
ncbi:AEC family transporter [Pseudovibrio denitrificans]|nr:AEC family transporter [Pseudovibrio denitrificans]